MLCFFQTLCVQEYMLISLSLRREEEGACNCHKIKSGRISCTLLSRLQKIRVDKPQIIELVEGLHKEQLVINHSSIFCWNLSIEIS